MNCEKCGGPAWDNSQKVAGGWKGPAAKCQDTEGCGWVKWPPKSATKAAGARGAKWTWSTLHRSAERCFLLAEKHVGEWAKRLKITPTMADYLAHTHTLLITVDRSGVQEAAPKSAAPAEPLDQRPAAVVAAEAEDDDLPF